MNLARDNILNRVRAAVRTKAPRPAEPSASAIWPPMGEAEARFREEFTTLKGEIIESLPEFRAGFAKIATDGSELAGAGNATVREADLGVTSCVCLVAQTGSIVVACRSGEERALSALPPVHLVVARRSQIVPDLDAGIGVLRQQYGGGFPSLISVISGPSRTADIEKVLVLGAHGPKRLAVHFVNT
jgi:L-lactate dehydrogenase complex protein LldG